MWSRVHILILVELGVYVINGGFKWVFFQWGPHDSPIHSQDQHLFDSLTKISGSNSWYFFERLKRSKHTRIRRSEIPSRFFWSPFVLLSIGCSSPLCWDCLPSLCWHRCPPIRLCITLQNTRVLKTTLVLCVQPRSASKSCLHRSKWFLPFCKSIFHPEICFKQWSSSWFPSPDSLYWAVILIWM